MFELFRDKLSNLKACASWVKGAHVYQMEQKLYILISMVALLKQTLQLLKSHG